MKPLIVAKAEQEMKLFRFLEKRLEAAGFPVSGNMLHRWIRSGQVRINGGRTQPFARLKAGDEIRLPPFAMPGALPDSLADADSQSANLTAQASAQDPRAGESLPPLLSIFACTPDLLVLAKAPGLLTQPGRGAQATSVVAILRRRFAAEHFIPAPAHRLDKDASGLLLAGRNHLAQRALHEALAAEGASGREYLAWISGSWPEKTPMTLRDFLRKERDQTGRELVRANEAGNRGKEALCTVRPLRFLESESATLMHVALHTGRTQQIRVQFASRGHPLIGDRKFGGPALKNWGRSRLLLHAFRLSLTLPGSEDEPLVWSSLPDWAEPWAVLESEI